MKKSIVSFFTALLLCVSNIGLCQDGTLKAEPELDRDAAIKAFQQLQDNAKTGLDSNAASAKGVKTVDGGKFAAIAPVDVPYAGGAMPAVSCCNGIRVWFELSNGRYVNPQTYRWAPGEVFYVHVQSAVPVYVTLYQNYTNGLPSQRVYPVPHFPNSYQMHMPGVSTRLPVAFAMDMNYRPEHMSIVVTRADWEGIRNEVPQAAETAVQAQTAIAAASASVNGTTATAVAAAGGILKGAEIKSDQALAKFAAINTAGMNDAEYDVDGAKCRVRYRVSYPRFVQPAYYVQFVGRRTTYVNVTNITNVNFINYRGCYHDIDDVAFYLFSDSGVGQMQITLNKIGYGWRWRY
jgi:hypothetical protein